MPLLHRLLVLACTATKRDTPDLLPAIERYDGPSFRVLRAYLRDTPSAPPQVVVISAEHGLIEAARPIASYDRRMTPARADALRLRVEPALDRIVANRPACFALGRLYLRAAGDAAPHATRLTGGIGVQLAGLKQWLHGTPLVPKRGTRLRTHDVPSREEIARLADPTGYPRARQLGAYAAIVGPYRVAPKWLVSRLSGLPVSAFHTADALGFLDRAGVLVEPA